LDTIIELEKWLIDNNVNNSYTSKHRFITDIGEGLEELDGLYIWYLIDEKGNRTNIEFFKNEKDAVNYVHQYLIKIVNLL
jgi:hypothetical protein